VSVIEAGIWMEMTDEETFKKLKDMGFYMHVIKKCHDKKLFSFI
jgi:hypothetical protein